MLKSSDYLNPPYQERRFDYQTFAMQGVASLRNTGQLSFFVKMKSVAGRLTNKHFSV
jgi:hypothetical protein